MTQQHLTESERATLQNVLFCAASEYDKAMTLFIAADQHGLASQFASQAKEARRLNDLFEQAETIAIIT